MLSVIIPTYNDASTLPQTLASVLAQDRPADEILIVNDAGSDPLPCLGAMAARVRLITLAENRGASAARNAGLAAARGEMLHFLDSDDVVSPDFLRLASAALAAHPTAAFALGDGLRCPDERFAEAVTGMDRGRPAVPLVLLDPGAQFAHVAEHPGAYLLSLTLWRRGLLVPAASGEWLDTRLATDEDFQMYLRTALWHGSLRLEAMMGAHRLRPGSLTKNPERVWRNRTAAMDLLLAEEAGPLAAHPAAHPSARARVLALRGNGARRVARLLLDAGRKAEARAVLADDIARAESLAARAKSALVWLRSRV